MSFLTLSGIPIPVQADGGGEVDVVNVGEYGRSFSGDPYSAVRARYRDYKGRWPLVPRADSVVYRLLVLGAGDACRFNRTGVELYTSKGVTPAPAESVTVHATGGPVASGPRVTIAGGGRLGWTMPASPLSPQPLGALAFWLKSASTSNAWKHYLLEVSPFGVDVCWQNGVAINPASAPHGLGTDEWLAVTAVDSVIHLEDQGASVTMDIAEVTWLPFQPTYYAPAYAAYLYNSGAGLAAESFPYVTIGGSWPESGSDVVLGEVGTETLKDVVSSGTPSIYSSREFTLHSRLPAR